MNESLRYRPFEERNERPLMKVADYHHAYRGYYDEGGVCRVRLFQKSALPPLVVVSQLEENKNTSITNMAEYLAAEIGAKHFPHRFETKEPFVWVEHYRHPEEADPLLQEIWSRVTFDTYTPKIITLGGVVRTKLGLPRWKYLPPTDMARLIGTDEMADYEDEEGRGEPR